MSPMVLFIFIMPLRGHVHKRFCEISSDIIKFVPCMAKFYLAKIVFPDRSHRITKQFSHLGILSRRHQEKACHDSVYL